MHDDRTALDIAWAAGLFEGEGNISYAAKTAVQLIVGMTDRDVVERFHRVIGCGVIRLEVRGNGHLTLYRWEVYDRNDVAAVLNLLLPWFGERRTAASRNALTRLNGNRGRNSERTHCPRGHPYDEENTYRNPRNGDRQCIKCRIARVAESRARAKEL